MKKERSNTHHIQKKITPYDPLYREAKLQAVKDGCSWFISMATKFKLIQQYPLQIINIGLIEDLEYTQNQLNN